MVRFFFFDFFYFLDYSETYRRMFHLYLNTLINGVLNSDYYVYSIE